MARSALPIGASALVAGLVLAPLAAVVWTGGGVSSLRPADWAAVRFTLVQAVLSALVSVALAIPVARALARRAFRGRGALITLLGAPFILPVIVAVLGLLAVFGQNGLVSQVLVAAGFAPVRIYGLQGVVLAHVFFNLPLAVRLILQGWQAIPAERLRLAAGLGLDARAMFRVIEAPMLARIVPGVLAIIFVLCLSSFAVALTLGGGPRATTVELAIYQAFRFDFDLPHAASLSFVQLALAVTGALLLGRIAGGTVAAAGLDRPQRRWDGPGRGARIADGLWIALAATFLILPLGAVVARGAAAVPGLPGSVWAAAGLSVGVALAATVLCLALALPVAAARWAAAAFLPLAVSPLVLGTGAFLLIHPVANPASLALPVTALSNALAALPFVVRALRPELAQIRADYGRLSAQLGLTGTTWWMRIALPRLRRPLGFGAGLVAALSMGDLGIVALFADPERATLPLKMFQLMGGYRMQDAAGAALLLLVLSLSLFWLFERGGRVNADA
jgi:thiamine transport system permease protein